MYQSMIIFMRLILNIMLTYGSRVLQFPCVLAKLTMYKIWQDYQMKWNPIEYGQVEKIRVPVDKVWLPDIVLFNNADGQYEVSYPSNVVVDNTGSMLWVPPTIYKSSCIIDVLFFPFDDQECKFKFGSWTYSRDEVQFLFSDTPNSLNLMDYKPSSIWDIIDCPARERQDENILEYTLKLRRKPLFYTVVLIVPSVLMALMSMMTFYLPTEAAEKVSLATSILLSLVVFMLLVAKILPPSSTEIPLMAKYLLLVFVLNVSTIATTVFVLNVYFRSLSTHIMSKWTRRVFIHFIGTVMLMKKPNSDSAGLVERSDIDAAVLQRPRRSMAGDSASSEEAGETGMPAFAHHPHCIHAQRLQDHAEADQDLLRAESPWMPLTAEAHRALEAIEYIADHLRKNEESKRSQEEWKFVALVLDRLLLYIFTGVTIGGTIGIILSASNIFENVNQSEVIKRLRFKYNWGGG